MSHFSPRSGRTARGRRLVSGLVPTLVDRLTPARRRAGACRSDRPGPAVGPEVAAPLHFHSDHLLITVAFAGGIPLRTPVAGDGAPGRADGARRDRGRTETARAVAGAQAAAELVAAWAALVLTAPLFLVVALAVRLSGPGPVLSRQAGIGTRGQLVELVRFRTTAGGGRGGLSAIGGLLRRTGIEGLPHLLNLARGDISLLRPAPGGAAAAARRVVPRAA